MRNLHRNKRDLWYALPVGSHPVLDDYGNDTLEVEKVFSAPIYLLANVSANMGMEGVEVFGSQTEYSRTVSITGAATPLVEGTRVWFGVDPDAQAANYNYTVARVADSKNGCLVALREVTPHG